MTPEEMSRLTAVEERSKSNTHRINDLSGQIEAVNKLAVSVELLVQENRHQTEALKEVKTDVQNLNGKVEAIEQKPAKRWDGIVDKVIWAIIAAVLTYLFVKAGIA